MRNLIKLSIVFLLGIFIISSCGKDDNGRKMNEYLSAFLKNNDSIVMFGSIDINKILDKTNYKKDSKIQALINKQLNDFRTAIDPNSAVYFALQGPLSEGNLSSSYFFLDVKNEDSLVNSMQQSGYDFTQDGDYRFHTDGDVAIGLKKDLAIVILKGRDYDGKKELKACFAKCEGELSGGKTDEILEQNGDILIGTNLNNLYATSNTDLSDLPSERKKEIKAMVNDSYIQTVFLFEKGRASIESKHMFNEDLKKRLFFKSDNKQTVLDNLGNGQPNAGLSMNFDLEKLENLINDYSPKTLEAIAQGINVDPMMMKLIGGNNLLSSIATGNIGALFYMDKENFSFGFNTFIGLTDAGKNLFPLVETKIPGSFIYEYTDRGVRAYTLPQFANIPNGKVALPNGCENFGTKGFTAFLYLNDLPMSEFGLPEEYAFMESINYLTIEGDENGSKIEIKAKNQDVNILEQFFDIYLDLAKEKIGGVAL